MYGIRRFRSVIFRKFPKAAENLRNIRKCFFYIHHPCSPVSSQNRTKDYPIVTITIFISGENLYKRLKQVMCIKPFSCLVFNEVDDVTLPNCAKYIFWRRLSVLRLRLWEGDNHNCYRW